MNLILIYLIIKLYFVIFINFGSAFKNINGDWGLGIGDWG